MSLLTIAGAFAAGLLSFLSPCVLPLTPVYVAQLTGPAIWRASELAPRARARLRLAATLHASVFVAGFAATFIALGATAGVLGSFLAAHQLELRQIGGLLLILFGLHVAGILPIPGLARTRRLAAPPPNRGYPTSFLVGVVFGFGWTPCVGPVLAGILTLAAGAGTLSTGVLLLAVYSLGLGVPFLLLGAMFDRIAPILKRLTPRLRAVELVTGLLLALMGVVIFFNWLLIVNGRFPVPTLG